MLLSTNKLTILLPSFRIIGIVFLFWFAELSIGHAQIVFTVPYSSQADFNLYEVKYKSQADLLLFKTQLRSRADPEKGLLFETKFKSQAQFKIYWTKYASQADYKVFFVKHPGEASYNSSNFPWSFKH